MFLALFLMAALGQEPEEDASLWSDEWGLMQPGSVPNAWVDGGRPPTPVIPMSGVGSQTLELKGNTYNHTVRVWSEGQVWCEGSTGLEPKDTPTAAAETAMWAARECLRMRFYSMGLGHEEVTSRMGKVLSREACRLETSRDDRTTHFDYRATLTCIAPVVKK